MNTETSTNVIQQYKAYLLGNYGPAPVTLARGEGCYVWDDEGRRYLDFGAGIAVNALGHCHPHWVERVQSQLATLIHCSNLYRIEGQGLLAERLVEKAGPGRLLFCNSGAEANEALIKLARLYGQKKTGVEGHCYRILAAENAFHGRTFGGMAATPQEKIQGGFRPMLEGFAFGRVNDIASFERAIDEQTCAVFLETIQGEGGIHVADTNFLHDLRVLCDEKDVLLMIDEVQCGIGRSGHFFAFEKAGIQPDAIGMAKGLGGGFPIGAIWVAAKHETLFSPGSHGTTFGGNPLACAAANAVLDVIEQDNLIANTSERGEQLRAGLELLSETYPHLIKDIRGMGLMLGIELTVDVLPVLKTCRESGLLLVPAGKNVIRFLPPLIVSREQIQAALEIFAQALAETEVST